MVAAPDPRRHEHVKVRMPGEKITKSLGGEDEAGLAARSAGALAQPGAEGRVGGVEKFAQQFAFALEERAEEARDGEDHMAMRHGLADFFRNDWGEGEGAALRAGCADDTLFAGEGVEETCGRSLSQRQRVKPAWKSPQRWKACTVGSTARARSGWTAW